MQKTILSFFFFLMTLNGLTQVPFQKTYGLSIYPEESRDIQKTFDGGYIVGGKAYRNQGANGNGDAYLLKLDYFGNVLWGKLYGRGGYNDFIEGVRQTSDSGYIIIGTYKPTASGKTSAFILKTDNQGVQQWNKLFTYPTEYVNATCMDLTSDGGCIFSVCNAIGMTQTASLIKMDAAGDTMWVKSFGSLDFVTCSAIKQTPDNGYILSGTVVDGIAYSTFMMKTDASGNTQWFKSYDFGAGTVNSSMNFTADGGYVLAGTYNYFSWDSMQFYIAKADAAGNILWTKTYGDSLTMEGKEIVQTADGGFLMNGIWRIGNTDTLDMYTLKTDSTGNVQWAKTFGGPKKDYGTSILEDNGNEYLSLGTYQNPNGAYSDIYLVRTDANGNSGCNEITQFPATQSRSVTLDTITAYQDFIQYIVTTETYDDANATENSTFCSAGIDIINNNRMMSIHPNPASQQIELELPGYDNASYFIYGSTGKLLQQGSYTFGQKIDIASLSCGFYTVRCETKDYHYHQKLIVTD